MKCDEFGPYFSSISAVRWSFRSHTHFFSCEKVKPRQRTSPRRQTTHTTSVLPGQTLNLNQLSLSMWDLDFELIWFHVPRQDQLVRRSNGSRCFQCVPINFIMLRRQQLADNVKSELSAHAEPGSGVLIVTSDTVTLSRKK